MPHIRRLRGDEWRAYREVRLKALADSPDAFSRTLESETGRSDSEWASRVKDAADSELDLPLVLDDGDRLTGLVWGKIFPSALDRAHLFQMWVAPQWRGHGFGALMVDQVIEWASERGAGQVILGVTEGNTPARRLYSRAGFVPTGQTEPLRAGSSLHCEIMTLELAGGTV